VCSVCDVVVVGVVEEERERKKGINKNINFFSSMRVDKEVKNCAQNNFFALSLIEIKIINV
jgi:hypothetical protein